jgi:hypothetical protein
MPPLDPLPAALLPWQSFYLLLGTAAATLTGLMFVAVTFGSSLVTRETAQISRAFLDPTYQHFVQVLLTACLATVPSIEPAFLGAVLLGVGLFRVATLRHVFVQFREAQRRAGDVELSDWLMSIVFPFACHLWLAMTGAGFFLHIAASVGSLAIVTLLLLFLGIHGAWELFVWMALAVGEQRRPSDRSPSSERSAERAE